jgi:hypothetical protein
MGGGLDLGKAIQVKQGVPLLEGKRWAKGILEEEDEEDENGSVLFWVKSDNAQSFPENSQPFSRFPVGSPLPPNQPSNQPNAALGTAYVFSNEIERSKDHKVPPNTTVFTWEDEDKTARNFNYRRLRGEEVPHAEHDNFIAERKKRRYREGLELFDDWLLRHCKQWDGADSGVFVDVMFEAPVAPSEVELHVEPNQAPAPPAHECIRSIELDSDTDTENEKDPDDGRGAFADFIRRRVEASIPMHRIHGIDPRDLGQAEDDQSLAKEPLPEDVEIAESKALPDVPESPRLTPHLAPQVSPQLHAQMPPFVVPAANASEVTKDRTAERRAAKRRRRRNKKDKDLIKKKEDGPPPLPSWEAYFGSAADFLYYSGHIKADYAPFLARCIQTPERFRKFFAELYFGTVPGAIAQLGKLDDEARSLTRLRSYVYRSAPGAALQQRPYDKGLVPVRAAPTDRYLKAAGSQPPRTWVSGLAMKLRKAGCDSIVDKAQHWFQKSVLKLLADPKAADLHGDYFVAWLRECYPEMYHDIDVSEPEVLRTQQFVRSIESSPAKRSRSMTYALQDIHIPKLEDAIAEIGEFKSDDLKASTKRQRVLAKILVDAYQLRLVDLAAILRISSIVSQVPQGARQVIVLYAGAEHTDNIISFWREQGFSHKFLSGEGFVGKRSWEPEDPRGLELPKYLHDFSLLFEV